jgi:hypothetical protein
MKECQRVAITFIIAVTVVSSPILTLFPVGNVIAAHSDKGYQSTPQRSDTYSPISSRMNYNSTSQITDASRPLSSTTSTPTTMAPSTLSPRTSICYLCSHRESDPYAKCNNRFKDDTEATQVLSPRFCR